MVPGIEFLFPVCRASISKISPAVLEVFKVLLTACCQNQVFEALSYHSLELTDSEYHW